MQNAEKLTPRQRTGLRLQAARRETGKPAAEVCRVLEVAPNKWSQWENGIYPPDVDTVSVFCDIYGVSLDWIYRGRSEALPAAKAERIFTIYSGLVAQKTAAA